MSAATATLRLMSLFTRVRDWATTEFAIIPENNS
jgi:hypothetical protein